DPRNWTDAHIKPRDLAPYLYPDLQRVRDAGVKAMYFAWFFRWSMFENYHYLRDKIGFKIHHEGRTIGTFTYFDSLDDKIDDLYYYMQFIKFGFGRCIRDASRLIQNGHMTREDGLELARKYDGEFPRYYFDEVLDYLSLSRDEFNDIVDMHRNPEVWKKDNGEWKLRYPVQ